VVHDPVTPRPALRPLESAHFTASVLGRGRDFCGGAPRYRAPGAGFQSPPSPPYIAQVSAAYRNRLAISGRCGMAQALLSTAKPEPTAVP